MRKKLTLSVSTDNKPYGVDSDNKAILLPEDFRKTVTTSIETGSFNNGDVFEVDVDKNGNPVRRSFDQTVAVHRPVEKKYSKSDIIELLSIAKDKITKGEKFNLEDYLD